MTTKKKKGSLPPLQEARTTKYDDLIPRCQGECTATVHCTRFEGGGGGERTVPDVPREYQNSSTNQDHPANSCQLHTEASIVQRSRILTSKPHHRCWWCSACTGRRCSSTSLGCCSTWSLAVARSRWWTTPFEGRPVGRGCRRQRWPRCQGWLAAMTPTTVESLELGHPTKWRMNPPRCRFRVFHLVANNNFTIFRNSNNFIIRSSSTEFLEEKFVREECRRGKCSSGYSIICYM